MKLTVTAPYMLAKTLVDQHYRDLRALTDAIAGAPAAQVAATDAALVQVDEANLTGHPEDAAWAARGERGVHLCFGNYGGQSIQKGLWHDLLPFLNALEADHLVLELARREPEELEVFRDLRPGLALGPGVIDIKDNVVERPEDVARAIGRAVKGRDLYAGGGT